MVALSTVIAASAQDGTSKVKLPAAHANTAGRKIAANDATGAASNTAAPSSSPPAGGTAKPSSSVPASSAKPDGVSPSNDQSSGGLSPFFPAIPSDNPAAQGDLKGGTGQFASPSDLSTGQMSADYNVINQQNAEFTKRYLLGEAIALQLPKPSQLLTLGGKLPAIRLEANYTEPISLKGALNYAIDNNLAIRISSANKDSQKWLAVSAFGGFLPNMIMNFQHQLLSGSSLIGGIIPSTFHTPNTSAQAGVQMFGFQGGGVLFSSLSQLHQFRAARHALKGTINDTLLAVTKAYYNLVRNQALLQIQTRAVEVSRAQVLLNNQLESAGTGTKFQVLQSETQLARDEQNLLTQEVALRNSAIDLATTLNLNSAVNFLSVEQEVRKVRLLDPSMDVNRLIALAIIYRPELRQFEDLRIAAKRSIQTAAAPLYPQMQFYANVFGNGATLTRDYAFQPGSFTPVPLNTIAGGQPVNLNQYSAVTSSTSGTTGAGNSVIFNTGEKFTPPSYVNRQMRKSYSIGVRVDWNYPGLGVPSLANVQSARYIARQAMLNSNQQLLFVLQQVRESYLNSATAERQIEVADRAVLSAAEELRLSRVRLANGVGTNIDVINAQRDFTTALVNKADAIIQFNITQAQLLHDIGLITTDTLTSGKLVKE
jgi:outer membrane protein TolC